MLTQKNLTKTKSKGMGFFINIFKFLQRHIHVVNLDQCTNITNDKLSDGKKTDYFVTLHSGSEDKQNVCSLFKLSILCICQK